MKMAKLSAYQRGITLIELMIAASLLATILVIAERAITGSRKAAEIGERRAQSIRDLDRMWILLENDLRQVIPHAYNVQFSEPLSALKIDLSDDYILMLIRGGQANPLLLPRSEVVRVGYRLEDEVLWRDSWIDPYRPDPETARQQQVMDGVEELLITALPHPPQGRSISEGPWLERWPPGSTKASDKLPLAIELKVTLKNRGELRRFITLPPGAG